MSKHYVVWSGREPGVYDNWTACKQQIDGFAEAKYKSYPSRREAEAAFADGWKKHWGQGKSGAGKAGASKKKAASAPVGEIDYNSVSVDVGTRGNPGPVEYKGVDTQTGEILFSVGPINKGTNNLGEFLAIVHALAYLKKQGSDKTVYSDSVNALKWVREKRVSTTLPRDGSTRDIWELVDRAEQWLHANSYTNKVLKWHTKVWGEIKADYGRK